MTSGIKSRRKFAWWWILAWLVLALVVWSGVRSLLVPAVPAPMAAAVEATDINQVVQASGTVEPRRKVEVGAQVTGQVRTVYVALGASVHKGDLLVSLDPELALNAVRQSEAALAQQQAALESKRIDLIQAQREVERQRRMLAGAATAQADAEKAQADLEKLEADVQGQTAQLGRLQADAAKAHLNLGYTQVTAPIDGDVVSISVQEGQTVNAQQQTPVLLTLAMLDTVTVKAQVAEADVHQIHAGQEASFVTLGDHDHHYSGLVRVVQPVPEKINNAVFYDVLFDVANPKRALMIDMSAQVTLRVAQVARALAIPLTSLGDKGADGRYTVQVLGDGGKVLPRKVKVGISDESKIQVLDGLKPGERVLIVPGAAASAPAP